MKKLHVKNGYYCFILLYCLPYCILGQSELEKKAVNPTVFISSTKDIFRKGEKINIKIEIINNNSENSKIPVKMLPNIFWLDFIIEDDIGKRIEFTGPIYKIRLYGEMNLLPGYFYGTNVELTSNYEQLLKSGKYSIQVSYGKAPLLIGKPHIKQFYSLGPILSNIINIRIE